MAGRRSVLFPLRSISFHSYTVLVRHIAMEATYFGAKLDEFQLDKHIIVSTSLGFYNNLSIYRNSHDIDVDLRVNIFQLSTYIFCSPLSHDKLRLMKIQSTANVF